MNYFKYTLILLLLFQFCSGFASENAGHQRQPSAVILNTTKASVAKAEVVNIFPHDPELFTEGLVYHKGYLYESTGLKGQSSLNKLEIITGKTVKKIDLAEEYFGEGMTIIGNKVYQLTWQHQIGFIYDLSSFQEIGKFSYQGDGWGLTTDGKYLIMSNGTSVITYIDPENFAVIRTIEVQDSKKPVNNINELEFIRGEIWANIFMEDFIVRISPRTGSVLGWIDLRQLRFLITDPGEKDVLNGIAYDSESDRIFVTGKYWPKLFEIKIQNQKMH
jgi:glutaminyl-peptide cyclotransferase